MRRITVIVGLLLLFVLPGLKAQGIMGHRFIAGVRFDYFAFLGLPADNFFTPGYKASLGYVTSMRTETSVGFGFYKVGLKEKIGDPNFINEPQDATDEISCTELDFTLRLYLKGFRKRSYDCIAPDGKYAEFGIITTKTKYTPGDVSAYSGYVTASGYTSTRIALGLGNQQVWWDKLAVNTGVLVSFPVYKWSQSGEPEAQIPYSELKDGRNYFRIYVGVGYVF